MTEKRFYIECNGIIDSWKLTNIGNDCKDRLSWDELCETLNQLDKLANINLNEYQLIVELEDENKELKKQLEKLREMSIEMRYRLKDMIKVIDND